MNIFKWKPKKVKQPSKLFQMVEETLGIVDALQRQFNEIIANQAGAKTAQPQQATTAQPQTDTTEFEEFEPFDESEEASNE